MPFRVGHELYLTWIGMRRRCLRPNDKAWAYYGGRGIKICSEWSSFERFVADMGPRPSKRHSLDRIDNDGNYTPENCRWATRTEQQRNQRTTRRVILDGNEYLVAELVEKYGLKHDTIIGRAAKGMSFEETVAKTRYPFTGSTRKAIEVRVRNQVNSTHCKHGHEYSPDNTSRGPTGARICKTCHRDKMRRLNAKKRSHGH